MLRHLLDRALGMGGSETLPPEKEKKNRRGKRHSLSHRNLRLESLENRELLSVSATDFEQIRNLYADLNLSANIGDYNIIEINADQLTSASLQAAINTAATTTKSDLIVVRTTATQNTITYASAADELLINIDATQYGGVTIVGWGDTPLTIDAAQKSRVMNITSSTVAIAGLTITGGYAIGSGGGIRNAQGVLTITNSTIVGNSALYGDTSGSAYSGGGIYSWGGTLTLTNTAISRNSSDTGGAIDSSSKLSITNCVITENTATYYGGGISNYGDLLTLTNSEIAKNSAGRGGAGIYSYGDTTLISGCIITQNSTTDTYAFGGGINNAQGVLTITNSTISENSAYEGGGINNVNGTLTVTNSIVSKNTASRGGGIYNTYGSLAVINTDIDKNSASYGGGIYNDYHALSLTVTDSTFTNNSVTVSGGGIYTAGNLSTITDSTFTQNLALYGGGIINSGELIIIGSTLSKNSTQSGGGIDNLGTLTVINSVIINNTATSYGGGIYSSGADSVLTVTGSAVSGNLAFSGGGICNTGTLMVTNCTFTENSAPYGAGIYNLFYKYSNMSSVINSTFAGNSVAHAICNMGGTLTVTNCTISRNESGGIYNSTSGTLMVNNCTIANNDKGGIANGGIAKVMNSTISGNTAFHGGIGNDDGGTLTVANCIISENTAFRGGGISNYRGTLIVTDSTISGNVAFDPLVHGQGGYGGGIYNCDIAIVTNCAITRNSASFEGGGIFVIGGMLTVTNCTISGNSAEYYGGIGSFPSTTLSFYNSIIVLNQSNNGNDEIYRYYYNDDRIVQGTNNLTSFTAWNGTSGNNLVYDATKPLFVDAANGDYRLVTGSQAIDKGDNSRAVYAADGSQIVYDLAGNARIIGGVVDLGAYEGAYAGGILITLVTPTLNAPTNITTSEMTVSWNTILNAAGYVVQYATNANFITGVGTLSSSTNSVTLSGLNANTTYYIRVMAIGTGSYIDSAYSAAQSATTQAIVQIKLATPHLIAADAVDPTAEPSNATLEVTWREVDYAVGYIIEYTTDPTFKTGVQTTGMITGMEFRLTGLEHDTKYSVRVIAVGTGDYEDSKPSNEKTVFTLKQLAGANMRTAVPSLTTPALTISKVTSSGMTLSWSKVTGAAGYVIEYTAVNGTVVTKNLVSTVTTLNLTGLTANTEYAISIKAIAATNGAYTNSEWSTQTRTTLQITLATPKISTVTAVTPTTVKSSATLEVKWAAVSKASGYIVQYSTDATFKTGVQTTEMITGTTLKLTGLKSNTKYSVRVIAVGTGAYGNSAASVVKSVVTLKQVIEAPTLASDAISGITSTSMKVSWDGAQENGGVVTAYVVQYSTSANFAKGVKSITVKGATECELKGLTAGATYYVRVKAIGTGFADSAYAVYKNAAGSAQAIKTFAKPVINTIALDRNQSLTDTQKNLVLTWSGVANAADYRIEYSTNSAFKATDVTTKSVLASELEMQNVNGVWTVTLDGLLANKKYFVRITAIGAAESGYGASAVSVAKSLTTAKVTLTPPSAPNVSVTSATAFNVAWNAVPSASSYIIEYSTAPGFASGSVTKTVTAVKNQADDYEYALTLTGLKANTEYFVRIVAVGTGDYLKSAGSLSTSITLGGYGS